MLLDSFGSVAFQVGLLLGWLPLSASLLEDDAESPQLKVQQWLLLLASRPSWSIGLWSG